MLIWTFEADCLADYTRPKGSYGRLKADCLADYTRPKCSYGRLKADCLADYTHRYPKCI